jgi:hypothetical protein
MRREGLAAASVTVRVLHRRAGLEARDRFAREVVLVGDLSRTESAGSWRSPTAARSIRPWIGAPT